MSFDLKDAKVGDEIFFVNGGDNKKNLNQIDHTGIVVGVSKDGVITIVHATYNGGKAGSIMQNKLNADGSIEGWTSNNVFSSVGRIDGKSETTITKSSSTTTGGTAITALSNAMKQPQQKATKPPTTTQSKPAVNNAPVIPVNPSVEEIDKFFGD